VDQGASVIVVDAGDLCAGATGYTSAKVTSLHGLVYADLVDRFGEDRARLPGGASEAAIRPVARLVDGDGIDCGFERRAHLAYTTDPGSAGSVAREAEVAARLGLPAPGPAPPGLPFGRAA